MWLSVSTRILTSIRVISVKKVSFLLLVVIFRLSLCSEECDSQNSLAPACEKNNPEPSPSNMAVVLYDEKYVSPFHKEKKVLSFGSKEITILQDWKNIGIAAVVWDAAVVLGEYLMKHADLIENKDVLELGAGTGVTGIVACLYGGRVTVTDRSEALEIIQKNVALNRAENSLDTIKVAELEWGNNHSTFPKYDVVIGADIIYIEETFDALLETFHHVCDCNTQVYLCNKIRYDRDLNFLDKMRDTFHIQEIYYDKQKDIYIYKCNKKC